MHTPPSNIAPDLDAADEDYRRGHRSARRPGPLRRLFGRGASDDDPSLDWAAPEADGPDWATPAQADLPTRDQPPAGSIPSYRAQHRSQGLGPGGLPDASAAARDPLAPSQPATPETPGPAPRVPSFTPAAGIPQGFSGPMNPMPAPAPEAKPPPAPASNGSNGSNSSSDGDLLYRVLGGLAMRDLTLVESLLQVVEKLEGNEEDEGQLELLFRIDHLATRMRRNSENLLVLAGHDLQGRDLEPVPLLDVARAAISEITDYSRAQIATLPDVEVQGVAADDVSHILAELLENATSKSPESATVVIRAERTGDGTMVISVEDSGIGIPSDQLADINLRLGRTPVVDPTVTRHMGLYVVGRLAQRHGIRVQLRERPYGGIIANVITPGRLVRAGAETAPQPARRPPVPPTPSAQPVPTAPVTAVAPADPSMLPQRTPGRGTPAGPPAPTTPAPPPPSAPVARADRIRDELADFQLGQREAQAAAPKPVSNGIRPRDGDHGDGPNPTEGTEAGST
ncbi:MAG TPA: ATP-binding protein [Streptosporangiaceae bacterium]